MKKFNLIIYILTLFIFGCGEESDEEETITYTQPTFDARNVELDCLRWIDRRIYFAEQDPFNSQRNNEFHKQKVQSVIDMIERNTKLGEDYFIVETVSPTLLLPNQPTGLAENEYRSFILIWDDASFDNFVQNSLGGSQNLVDQNAVTVINPEFRRKFYMIFRSSCFRGDDPCNIGDNGLNALISRQMGLLLRIPPFNCATDPTNIMCVEASDSQWNDPQKIQFFYDTITGQLINIERNLNFFQDAEQKANCLVKPWMDRQVFFASGTGNLERNNPFHKTLVQEGMNEIASETLLGANYFSYQDTTEANLDLILERTDTNEILPSWVQIWDDESFNRFILEDKGGAVPDPNGFMQVNRANRDQFNIILRTSCFQNSPLCGLREPLDENGVKALVARQLGFMVGLDKKSCITYPNDVMCTEEPKNEQWSIESRFIFINKFNNALEFIGNIPQFYNFFREDIDLPENE